MVPHIYFHIIMFGMPLRHPIFKFRVRLIQLNDNTISMQEMLTDPKMILHFKEEGLEAKMVGSYFVIKGGLLLIVPV